MHNDVTSCVIRISIEVEYLEKEGGYQILPKRLTLSDVPAQFRLYRPVQ